MSDHTADPVNHPGHYTSHPSGVECIQITEHMSFCLGNAIKYIWRADLKGNAIEDLQKAHWYVDREIARLGGEPAVLDRLAADGRLLTEGGTVLDAGQWAMVRTLIEASHRKPEVQRAADRLRDEFKVGRCRCGGLIAEPSPGCEWHSAREVTPPAASVPDSGPDGTPEKPWPTWQEAPDGVVYRGTHRDGSPTESRWMNRGGECWVVDGLAATHPESYRLVNSVAPFVRAEGRA